MKQGLLAFSLGFALMGTFLYGCGNNPGTPGQWYTYGGTEPTVTDGQFAFPAPPALAGYFYTRIAIPKVGQTLTLNYSVSGNAPTWVQSDKADTNPPTMHLFLWRKGDDLSCVGAKSQYRMFAGRTDLVLGSQSISVPLTPDAWTGCYAAHSTSAQWSDLLNNLLGAGFTFGGQSFAGHGVSVTSGSAIFKINSMVVQ